MNDEYRVRGYSTMSVKELQDIADKHDWGVLIEGLPVDAPVTYTEPSYRLPWPQAVQGACLVVDVVLFVLATTQGIHGLQAWAAFAGGLSLWCIYDLEEGR